MTKYDAFDAENSDAAAHKLSFYDLSVQKNDGSFVLDKDELFPGLSGKLINGKMLYLPQDIKSQWTIILGYRAPW